MEALRRQPAGTLVAYAFDGEQAEACASTRPAPRCWPHQLSLLPRWVSCTAKSPLGDAGAPAGGQRRSGGAPALSLSGWALPPRRMGAGRRPQRPVPGSALQRLHVQRGRWGCRCCSSPARAALVLAVATQGWLETEPTLEAAEP